ncbi:MAG: NDP-sugar synthase, partial [Chloroflexi bacterium]|nr:NDP-sugar synthase [Chloroflexota bacterium]
ITKFIVLVGEDEGAVAAYLNQYWVPNASVQFVIQSNKQSLTAALAAVVPLCPDSFLLTTYKSFLHPHYPERLLRQQADTHASLQLTATLRPLSQSSRRYFAHLSDQTVTAISDQRPAVRASLILAETAVCGPAFAEYIAAQPIYETSPANRELMPIFRAYVRKHRDVFVSQTAWTLQVETDSDLFTLNKQLLDEDYDAHMLSELPSSAQVIPPVRIDPRVSVGQNVVIGPYVYLESGCSVGRGAVVRKALILQKVIVPPDTSITDAIVATRAHIDLTTDIPLT